MMSRLDWSSASSDGERGVQRRPEQVAIPHADQGVRDSLQRAYGSAVTDVPDDLRRLLNRLR